MLRQFMHARSWAANLVFFFFAVQQVLAYRPVQHCKTLGDNGHYSACAALTQNYNGATGESDLYLRYHWFRYRNSKNGWHAFAIGEKMAGALMLIMYGDPNTPSLPMTVDIRTSEGHAPPRPIAEVERFAKDAPPVEIVTAKFEEYHGDLKIESLNESPTHVGICEAIIRGYEKWSGFKVSNTSLGMDMLWSSNYQQDMENDFSLGRNIDMHAFALGFGFLYVDILNAETPEPMFGPLNEMAGMRGAGETRPPNPPTKEEMSAGDAYISSILGGSDGSDNSEVLEPSPDDHSVEEPARTVLGKTLRDWMWHLHGLMMSIAFLALYPLGTYLIRSGKPTSFNMHWTVQALGTVALVIGSGIGYMNSHSISIKHQYIGIAITLAIALQIVLGWRHHVQFVATKRKGWLSKTHIALGRIVLPLGYVNFIMGILLRGYGWFTIAAVVILMALESVVLILILSRASEKREMATELRPRQTGAPRDEEAEEFFQLEGDDDFSDSEGEDNEARATREQERREQAEKLRRLDRV